jgi:hypothetical protein
LFSRQKARYKVTLKRKKIMVIKLKHGNRWIYLDGVLSACKETFRANKLVNEYDNDLLTGKRLISDLDFCTSSDEQIANKIFHAAAANHVPYPTTDGASWYLGYLPDLLNCEVTVIGIQVSDPNKSKVYVTNQDAFLLNDKGQTMERLA